MKKLSFTKLAIGSSITIMSLISTSAWADPINPRPAFVNPVGGGGSEISLQQVFNNITVAGPAPNAVTDQVPFALFTSDASGGSVATFIIEIAGNAGSNTFGIYSATNPANRAEIFSGANSAGTQKLVSFFANGDIGVNNNIVANGFAPSFGFYLDGPGTADTFFSEDSLNGNNPQALIYQGSNTATLQIASFQPGLFTDDEFIIAFEDLAFANSDRDYQDLVVMVESIRPSVPEPGTIALLGIGLGGIALARRRRLSKQ